MFKDLPLGNINHTFNAGRMLRVRNLPRDYGTALPATWRRPTLLWSSAADWLGVVVHRVTAGWQACSQ